MSHPDGLPDLFVDRSLGRLVVPDLLRAAGLRLITLAERDGMPANENVPDVTWLADAGSRGEAALMKDERIARNVAERNAIAAHGVRCFCLARADLTGRAMAELYLAHPRVQIPPSRPDRVAGQEATARAWPIPKITLPGPPSAPWAPDPFSFLVALNVAV
ncbi:MAG: hypothetical protein M3Y91_12720 [Actinomycetota bacterium]|nr:hypothetical protein [Actinomycetota bacterium]